MGEWFSQESDSALELPGNGSSPSAHSAFLDGIICHSLVLMADNLEQMGRCSISFPLSANTGDLPLGRDFFNVYFCQVHP